MKKEIVKEENQNIVAEFRFGKIHSMVAINRVMFESVPLKAQLDIIEATFNRMRDGVRATVHETAGKIIV